MDKKGYRTIQNALTKALKEKHKDVDYDEIGFYTELETDDYYSWKYSLPGSNAIIVARYDKNNGHIDFIK